MEDMVNLAEDTVGVAAATMDAADVGTTVVVDAAPLPMRLHGRASQLIKMITGTTMVQIDGPALFEHIIMACVCVRVIERIKVHACMCMEDCRKTT